MHGVLLSIEDTDISPSAYSNGLKGGAKLLTFQ